MRGFAMKIVYGICLVIALCLALIYAFQGYYPEPMSVFSNVFAPIIAGAAFVSASFAFHKYGTNIKQQFSLIWLNFAIGMLFWFLGESLWAVYTILLEVEIPYPSLADVFWLVGYVPMFMALCLYVKIFASALSKKVLSITIVAVTILVILVFVALIMPLINSGEDSIVQAVNFAYILLDLVSLSTALLGLAIFLKGRLGKSWLLINAGMASYTIADMLFSYTTTKNTYYTGHPLELLYHWGYILFLLAFYIHTKEL